MKISCNVIKDILPLYAEDLASEESRELVEEHIDSCDKCTRELEDMKSSPIVPMDTDMGAFKKIRKKMRRKKCKTILFTTMITMVIIIASMSFLTAPDYINDVTSVSIVENTDGTLLANFSDEVSGYDIERNGNSYVITTWNSIWSRNVDRERIDSVVLNPQGENIESVYYYHTDGRLNALKYGKNQFENGGSLTLPRLALSYYLTVAIGLTIICLIIVIISRKNKKIRGLVTKIMFLPISYILGHIIIKGTSSISYSMQRDFYAIILVMIGLYVAILLALDIMNESNKRSP